MAPLILEPIVCLLALAAPGALLGAWIAARSAKTDSPEAARGVYVGAIVGGVVSALLLSALFFVFVVPHLAPD